MDHRLTMAEAEPQKTSDAGNLIRQLYGQCTRISTRLLLIITACLLPAIALNVIIGCNLWDERKAQLEDLAREQAELLASDINGIAEGARILLAGAAEFHHVRGLEDACHGYLQSLQRSVPSMAFLMHIDIDGQARCVSRSDLLGKTDDLGWIDGAISVAEFTAGRFARSERFPGGFVPFYLPLGSAGSLRVGTLVAALDLNWLEQHLHKLKRGGSAFRAGGVLTVVDADGVVLARDTKQADFVGKRLPPAAMPMIRAAKPGVFRIKSIDGTFRLVGYTPPTTESYHLGVAVGFFEPELMGDVRRALMHWALLFGSVTAAVFGITILVAKYSIARPTRSLLAVAHRWREGDLDARAPHDTTRSEFGQLAAAYNAMAAAIQSREEKVQAYASLQETRIAERTRELVVTNARLRQEMAERQTTEAALLQAQKVQAVGQLAGGIAHDFNNVLQTVSGSASLIQRRADDPAAVRRLGQMIEDAARRGGSITRRLLTFSRREELRAETLDVRELIVGLHEVLGATLGLGVVVKVDVATTLPFIWADRGQLETVLVNLATNARDAMPGGGVVTILARSHDVTDGNGPQRLRPGRYICLTVSDTGKGMDAATLARASEAFFTTKSLGRGTGLGLTMARSFAEGSAGELVITSEPGCGTDVALWLPAVAVGTRLAPVAAVVGRPPVRLPLRIILADDDAAVREIIAAPLREAGYEVTEAEDVPSALHLLESGQPVDLVISDLAMPGLDGMVLIREAQRRQPGLPAILLTGYAGDAAELAIGRAVDGRFALLRKPVTSAHLVDQVEALVALRVV